MKIDIDGRKIPKAAIRGPIDSLAHGKSLGMAGLFYRIFLVMSPTLDPSELRALRLRADELGMYVEAGLGKVNPLASAELPDLRRAGDGNIGVVLDALDPVLRGEHPVLAAMRAATFLRQTVRKDAYLVFADGNLLVHARIRQRRSAAHLRYDCAGRCIKMEPLV